MKRNYLLKKSGVVGIIIIFICSSFVSNIGGYSEDATQLDIDIEDVCELKEDVLVTCNTFGFPGEPSQEITMSPSDAEFLYDKIKELQFEVARDPLSDKTQQLQHEIISLADEHNLLPAGLSAKTLQSRLTPTLLPQHPRITLPRLQNKASEMFCNYVSTGSGSALPIIILPRLIPILLTPIPRLFVRWSTMDGITSCGGLRSGTGFIAYGAQNGIALGFWGIGFSIFLPPVMAYGLFGYALYASVNAEEIELWPPNNPPVISNENPPSETWNVPVSLSELSFQIEDADGDPMSYSVTTSPDIGSGSGTNKGDGVYTVPVSGLKSNTQYQWVVEVADSEDVTMRELSFMTEELPFDPFEEGWHYRKQITIDHTQVAGDLSYFPVLISTVDSDLQGKAQDDGDDVLFMDGPGVANKLYHEIEQYDGTSGDLISWVNVVDLSADGDTVLYVYYGNPNSGNQQMSERVWSPYYAGVWHLDDLYDSSSNTNDGSNHGSVGSIGKVEFAREFDGIGDYIEISDDPSLDIIDKITITAWAKIYDRTKEQRIVSKVQRGSYGVGIGEYFPPYGEHYPPGYIYGILAFGYEDYCFPKFYQSLVDENEWFFIGLSFDGSHAKIYLNAEEMDDVSHPVGIETTNVPLLIGADPGGTVACFFNGVIDEVRISTIARNQPGFQQNITIKMILQVS